MKTVKFYANAADDLHEVAAYYESVAPRSAPNILADIHRTIERLSEFPNSGIAVPGKSYRRAVSLRYRFNIVHVVSEEAVIIVGVFREQFGRN